MTIIGWIFTIGIILSLIVISILYLYAKVFGGK